MKKMLAVFSAALVAAFALHADDLVVGSSFEEVADGEYTQTIGGLSVGQRGEDFGLVGLGVPGYWYVTNDFTAVTTNYQYTGTMEPIPMRPDMFAGVNNTKAMEMECGTLFRTVKDVTSRWPYGETEAEKFMPQEIGGGLYFDTLVKFTAAEDIPEYEINAKVSLSYVEHVADPEEDPSDTESFTNLVVWAGFLSEGESYPQAFRCEVPEGFDKHEFHRVTIRTIADIGPEIPGFVIYLDQQPLRYSVDTAAMDEDEEERLNAFAKTLYNGGVHQLFPSMVRHGSEMNTISCAAFSGAGVVDDVEFTDVTPAFINEDKLITVNWTEGLTHIRIEGVKDGDIDVDTEGAEGSREFKIDGRSDEITVIATYDEADGYSAGNWTASGGVQIDQKNGKFSGLITGSSCNVAAMRALCEVDGVAFDNLEDAVAAAKSGTEDSPALFKLLASPEEMLYFDSGDEMYYVVLDLNGKTMEASPDDYDATIYNENAHLVITNSSDTVAYVNPAALYCLYADGYGQTYTEIFAGVWTGEICIDDSPYGNSLQLYGGTYWDLNEQEEPADFYLVGEECCDPENVTYVGDCYFQVGGGTPPPPPPADEFKPDEEIGEVKLTAEQADWLNSYDDYANVKAAVKVMAAADFQKFFLLGLDVRDDASDGTVRVTTMACENDIVVLTIELSRSGTVFNDTDIPGTVELWGSATLTGAKAKVATAVVGDEHFSVDGETATITFDSTDVDGMQFFNVVIK